MKPASMPSFNSCRRLAPAVTTFVDGELEPSQVVEVEAHLSECGRCRERVALDKSLRSSLRALPKPAAPEALRQRLIASMAAEARDNGAADEADVFEQAAPPARAPYKYMAPLAMAAGFALLVAARSTTSPDAASARVAPSSVGRTAAASTVNASMPMGLDSLIEELVTQHAQPLPPEVTRQDDVRSFDPFVGVPVEAPQLTGYGAKFFGGRMLPVREQRAAMLQYHMAGGHRVTVYVYDPRRVQPEQRWLRERGVVRNGPVYVGQVRGYNVAAATDERRGIGYAVATDLGEPESVEIATTATESF